jgi:hypothetical protein
MTEAFAVKREGMVEASGLRLKGGYAPLVVRESLRLFRDGMAMKRDRAVVGLGGLGIAIQGGEDSIGIARDVLAQGGLEPGDPVVSVHNLNGQAFGVIVDFVVKVFDLTFKVFDLTFKALSIIIDLTVKALGIIIDLTVKVLDLTTKVVKRSLKIVLGRGLAYLFGRHDGRIAVSPYTGKGRKTYVWRVPGLRRWL